MSNPIIYNVNPALLEELPKAMDATDKDIMRGYILLPDPPREHSNMVHIRILLHEMSKTILRHSGKTVIVINSNENKILLIFTLSLAQKVAVTNLLKTMSRTDDLYSVYAKVCYCSEMSCDNKDAKFKCAQCKCTYYCSTECQHANWAQHKQICYK
jgi:hypothetical protein